MRDSRSKAYPSIVFALLCAALACGGRAWAASGDRVGGAPASHELDGKRFAVQVGKQGEADGEADTLSFGEGRFHSSARDALSFASAPYITAVSGDTTRVITEIVSPADGKIAFKLSVRGEAVEGVALWRKEHLGTVEYWVKGTLSK